MTEGMDWFDTNGDGLVDTGMADTGGDGRYDTAFADTDGDGLVDGKAYDFDGDGVLETYALDQDRDGSFETSAVDTDGDGLVDQVFGAPGGSPAAEPAVSPGAVTSPSPLPAATDPVPVDPVPVDPVPVDPAEAPAPLPGEEAAQPGSNPRQELIDMLPQADEETRDAIVEILNIETRATSDFIRDS
ncbi:hypothetical protein [Nocardioides bigeumensis]|uniref:EF-hand domain-containing protein n=1 Tax=Nocardioides bigeumensis TaxID=433657 RepID=A0ABN2YBT2_9ACTN